MPTISLFYGILISMYFEKDGQHHTPHFHARYGEFKAEYDFIGDILAGMMPQSRRHISKPGPTSIRKNCV